MVRIFIISESNCPSHVMLSTLLLFPRGIFQLQQLSDSISPLPVAIPMDPGGGKNKGSGGGKEVLCSPCHTVYLMSRWVFLFLLLPSSVFKFERNAA